MSIAFSPVELANLHQKMESILSGYRLTHTKGVERMASRLSELYCPEKKTLLQAAALLHDLTKELSKEEQFKIYESCDVFPDEAALASPKTVHAVTAAMLIPRQFPMYAYGEVLDAVRYHTTGRADMSLSEKLIFLADYIEEGRTFPDCVLVRKEFFDAEPEKMTHEERLMHLNRVILHCLDLTISELCAAGQCISLDTVKARNSIIFEIEKNIRKK